VTENEEAIYEKARKTNKRSPGLPPEVEVLDQNVRMRALIPSEV
jgi:hypothetical protein